MWCELLGWFKKNQYAVWTESITNWKSSGDLNTSTDFNVSHSQSCYSVKQIIQPIFDVLNHFTIIVQKRFKKIRKKVVFHSGGITVASKVCAVQIITWSFLQIGGLLDIRKMMR